MRPRLTVTVFVLVVLGACLDVHHHHASRCTSFAASRLGSVLVVAEVATAVILLFGAGLLLRTLLAVEHVDRGYGADGALTMMVDPLGSRYPTERALVRRRCWISASPRSHLHTSGRERWRYHSPRPSTPAGPI
jgi:hypothetical protein